MTRFRYDASLPADLRAIVEPHLMRWADLAPAWCHEVCVRWDDDDTEAAIRVDVSYEYRNADLYVLANFLSKPTERDQHIVHELMHLSLAPLTAVAEAMRDALVTHAPDVKAWADEMLRQGEESTTCDLTHLLMGKLG